MQFKCLSEKLKHSIAVVEKAVSQKSSLPVLENIFLELKGTQLKLRGNNLEIGIENGFLIEEPISEGSVLVKAKTLSNIFSKIDDNSVAIAVDETQKLSIKGENVDFAILGSHTQDYPVFPSIDEGLNFSLKSSDLQDLIKHTLIAVSHDETKQFLNGILVKNDQDKLMFVSTDGYRLALKRQTVPPFQTSFESIIPYKAVSELNRILQNIDNEKDVNITISENQIAFQVDDFILISRVIQGQFPNYKQVIPEETGNKFKVNRETFLAAADRASLIATASNNVVRFSFDQERVTIEANAKGLGDFKEDVALERISGEENVKIAFNIRLLLDVIKTVNTDDIQLAFNNELSPCKITIKDNEDFVYIIMPIRTADYQN
ncbi:DNA polymerase III subunit beta [bacterium]|nr:DNA polymerase III subunit beta [bacterium]